MNLEVIKTERLNLDLITPEVVGWIFEDLSETEQLAFFGFEGTAVLEKEKKKYIHGLTSYNRSFINFRMTLRATEEVIGWCGYHNWYLDHDRAEIGYSLVDDTYKGQGYMSEALKPIIAYGFDVMKLNRIEAFVSPHNEPSLALVRKFGFTREGCLKAHYLKNGRYEDSEIWGLINVNLS